MLAAEPAALLRVLNAAPVAQPARTHPIGGPRLEGRLGEAPPPPFPPPFVLTPEDLARDEGLKPLLLTGEQRARANELAREALLGSAVALEKAVNGTSLVLMFEVGDAFLLFSGDAQWGTWRRILDDEDASALVARTTFLKVGHHGGHSATPKRLVELLAAQDDGDGTRRPELAAMVSTHHMDMWPLIPKAELIAALRELTPKLARSDETAGQPVPGFSAWTQDHIDVEVPV